MEEEFCLNCQKQIAKGNFVIHVAHCHRFIEICSQCSEPVPKKDLEQHLAELHTDVECAKCFKRVQKWKLPDHEYDECGKRPVACLFCELEVPWDEIKNHEDYCGSRTEICPHCRKYVCIKDKETHTQTCMDKTPIDRKVDLERLVKNQDSQADIPSAYTESHIDHQNIRTSSDYKRIIDIKEQQILQGAGLTAEQLNLYGELEHSLECRHCKLKVPLKEIKLHENICGSKTEICVHCKNNVNISVRELHQKLCLAIKNPSNKDQKKMIPCAYCEIEFSEEIINEHEECCEAQTEICELCKKTYHMDEKAMHRNVCGQKFVYVQKENVSETLFICKFCGKKYFWASVSEHELICSERTEECSKCKRVIKADDLKLHVSQCLQELHASGETFQRNNLRPVFNNETPRDVTLKRKNIESVNSLGSQFEQLRLKDKTERKIIAPKSNLSKIVVEVPGTETARRGLGREKISPFINETLLKSEAEGATAIKTVGEKSVRQKLPAKDVIFAECPNCRQKHPAEFLHEHTIKCPSDFTCQFCMKVMKTYNLRTHLEMCVAKHIGEHKADKVALNQQNRTNIKSSRGLFHRAVSDLKSNINPPRQPLQRPPIEESFLLPCEFCGAPIPAEILIEHQSGCRPDLLHFPDRQSSEGNDAVLPDMVSETKNNLETKDDAKDNEKKIWTEEKKNTKVRMTPSSSQSKRGRTASAHYYNGKATANVGEFLNNTQYAGYPEAYRIYDTIPGQIISEAFQFRGSESSFNKNQYRPGNKLQSDGYKKVSSENFETPDKKKVDTVDAKKVDTADVKDVDTADVKKVDVKEVSIQTTGWDKAYDSSEDEFLPCQDVLPVKKESKIVMAEDYVLPDKQKQGSNKSSPTKKQKPKKAPKKAKKKSRR